MTTNFSGDREEDGAATHPYSTMDQVRSALVSYQVLFERAAFTAQLADDERLHQMLDTLELFGLVTDVRGHVTYMNTAMRDRLECSLDEVLGRGLLVAGADPDQLKLAIRTAADSGKLVSPWTTEVPLTDATAITVRWTSTFIRDEHGQVRGLTSVGEDITEVEPSDAQITESVRMESLGRFAGGVAHDFNNFLAVIAGYTGLVRAAPGLPDEVPPNLDQIDAVTQRATELIRQLLAFGRQDVNDPTTISVSEVLGDLAALIRPTFRDSITIEVVTATNDDLVNFDRCHLDQIFVNLAFNSRDAMPDGGTITYGVTDLTLDPGTADNMSVEPGSYVVVTVTDDGDGIDADIIDHVFKRHVTTKPPGQGNGLGLATVHNVITQAGGAITVEAERETGTEFTLYFPRAISEHAAGPYDPRHNLPGVRPRTR